MINALEEFNNLGVDFISYKENIDTSTPAGKILFTMISAFAEFERVIIWERVIACMEKAKTRGVRIGRPKIPPFTIEKRLEMKEQGAGYKEITKKLKICLLLYFTSRQMTASLVWRGREFQKSAEVEIEVVPSNFRAVFPHFV